MRYVFSMHVAQSRDQLSEVLETLIGWESAFRFDIARKLTFLRNFSDKKVMLWIFYNLVSQKGYFIKLDDIRMMQS